MLKSKPYLYEIPLFYLLLILANRIFFSDIPGFIDIDPHPYWAGILIFSFRYGLPAASLSSIVSIVIYLTYAWKYYDHYLFQDISFYALPFYFVTIALIIGWLVRNYQRRFDVLLKEK